MKYTFKKIISFIRKLYIPLYLYFIITVVFVNFFVSFFEQYSKVDFQKITQIIEENKASINNTVNEEIVTGYIEELSDIQKNIDLNKKKGNLKEIDILEEQKNLKQKEIINRMGENFREIRDENLPFKNRLEKIKNNLKEKLKKDKLDQINDNQGYNLRVNIDNKNIDITKSSIFINKKIKEMFFKVEENLKIKYFDYKFIHFRRIIFVFIIFWLWPVYKYNFGFSPYTRKCEERIINLSFALFSFIWVYGLYGFIFRTLFVYRLTRSIFNSITGIYFVSFLLFSSLASYINLAFSEKYIKNKIAFSVFSKNNLYSLKNGKSFYITSRISLFIILFSILPIVLLLYIPMNFHFGVIKSVFLESSFDIGLFFYLLFPLFIMILLGIYFLIPQIFSIFWFKRSIQGPINRLIERMNMVSRGDFTSKASVLSNDEIGKLRGHFNEMVEGLQEREKIRDTFGKFVSLEIAEKLISQGSELLEGEEIETTVMFTDIRNFTPFSENLTPKELVDFLNLYFSYICAPIVENKGVINKFIGDSVMAVFSPVFGVENHADAALKAAIGIRKALKKFNSESKYTEIIHGIGIHTGILVSGKIGTKDRMEYTVIGDTVNIASRIESQTKIYKDDILISEFMFNKLNKKLFSDLTFHAYEPVIMKGKSNEMILYGIKEGINGKG
ncbi:MAG: HAMP domain-containing protein [Candidatus Muirbacterium halophilum]|nr:HAMP domain-containing protein [Candidatus Muirbacterium halophilum]MCK9477413.1 HAMP domain-containing protein [Candidatus Muirbacterium halophilum]